MGRFCAITLACSLLVLAQSARAIVFGQVDTFEDGTTMNWANGAPGNLVTEASRRKWRAVWPWVLVNSLAGQTLGVSAMQWALETTPTGIVLAVIAITPVVVIPFAFVLEGKKPTLHSLFGGIVAVAGVIALTLAR